MIRQAFQQARRNLHDLATICLWIACSITRKDQP